MWTEVKGTNDANRVEEHLGPRSHPSTAMAEKIDRKKERKIY